MPNSRDSNHIRRDSEIPSQKLPNVAANIDLASGQARNGKRSRESETPDALLIKAVSAMNEMIDRGFLVGRQNGIYQISNQLCRKIISNMIDSPQSVSSAIRDAVRSYYGPNATTRKEIETISIIAKFVESKIRED